MAISRSVTQLGIDLYDLSEDLADWSQSTFGLDTFRGPAGPLKHLKKEVDECLASPYDKAEYADLLILVLDASRRAGISAHDLVKAALAKMEVNQEREWPAPSTDEPVEHIRDQPPPGKSDRRS